MQKFTYPANQTLWEIYQQHSIVIKVSNQECLMSNTAYPKVEVSIDKQKFQLYVDDEYEDFKKENSLLSFCLVLRELENYQNGKDYLDWCTECELDPGNTQIKEYYSSLAKTFAEIKLLLGMIDSQISDYDFSLNDGAAQELRKGAIF
jgi:hypothetical protein